MSIFLSPTPERNFCLLVDKLNDDDSSDDEISQEKVKIWVSKELLAVVSPVFYTMFYGDFRESHQTKAKEPIYLPGKNSQEFLEFLDCLFPYLTQIDINETNIVTVLRLSDEYQVKYLMDKCDQYLEKAVRGLPAGYEYFFDYLSFILSYKLKRATEACVPFAAALPIELLSKHRSENRPAFDGYHHFYSAVYEAKLRRTLHEQHEIDYRTNACKKCRSDCKVPSKCLSFHSCSTKSDRCICGYEFQSIYLNS